MLRDSDVDPKMRKSALVQINVMLTDTSLHKLFLNENGLFLILQAFNSALVNIIYYFSFFFLNHNLYFVVIVCGILDRK